MLLIMDDEKTKYLHENRRKRLILVEWRRKGEGIIEIGKRVKGFGFELNIQIEYILINFIRRRGAHSPFVAAEYDSNGWHQHNGVRHKRGVTVAGRTRSPIL